jgi:capsular polysaccharide biosynthesis protein
MPDIIAVINKRWKLILALTSLATLLALVVSLLRPKEYVATVTALPANSMTADKGRIFNPNIETLYPEIGTPDELDKIEGTSKLDTLFIAVAELFDLAPYYAIDKNAANAVYKAALALKKNTDIRRSAYGELKIRVWDGDAAMAAQLANALMNKLNEIHQHILNANNTGVLQRLKKELEIKEQQLDSIEADVVSFRTANNEYQDRIVNDTTRTKSSSRFRNITAQTTALTNQIKDYYQIISQYELVVNTNPQVLIAVENARPSVWPDKPKVFQTTLFAFGASLIFSFLLALFAESRSFKK